MPGHKPARTLGATPSRNKRELLARLLDKHRVRTAHPSGEARIQRRPDAGPVPLSFAQESIWFLDQLEPNQALHNVPGAVRLAGRLDVAALELSLREIVRRHEALRTTFATTEGRPYQVVAPPGGFALPLTDLSDRPKDEAEEEALRLATEEAHHAFDLETGPVFRAFLIRLGEAEHILVLNFHHIVIDGWSMGVFTQELGQLYRAFRQGEPSPLEELPIQLGDFAVWQREALESDALAEQLAYWKQQLGGHVSGLTLPTDRPRPAVQSFRGRHQAMRLSGRLSDEVRALSRRQGVTLFMTLTAAFEVLLYDLCHQTDVVIGTAAAHRNRRELEGLIGFLVNMLVLRTDLSGNPSFPELLRRVRDVTLGAWSHQDLPLTRIMKEVQPERDLSRNPLFQVEFSLLTPDHNPAVYGYGLASGLIETLELSGLVMTPVNVQYENARYDIAVFLWDMPHGIQGTIEYSTDLFDEETIERIVGRYHTLLRTIVHEPELSLDALIERLGALDHDTTAAAALRYQQTMKQKLSSISRRRSDESGGAAS